ncbi:MFS transporter [Janthinobacterium agaricidamnosum]|uniref:Major Facilitator Superfamily protein n=1 Tax=Janthinobacterium agaricidamnosum NBRC 102515 = DSM 9628 TaxID=1349767 RepID=W0V1E5_9BURK|nr:MFS transporter [Janthinobacterium agaricidamnosum]CDG81097.1 major Facilitator Superfamily protein [Janthinobacterium agaricidamnosum NBRC 102515 = DSM 9628]
MECIGPLQQRATRLVFFAAGLGMATWAPLVPYAKERLGLEEGALGLLLLCLGCGSLFAMPFTGALSARFGCRRVILASGAILSLLLPGLALAASPWELGLVLFLFGASAGTFDVAINIQAVIVEKASGRSMMSGFHALFSVGGFAGAGLMALLLWLGLAPAWSCAVIIVLMALVLSAAQNHLLHTPEPAGAKSPLFVMPHGSVILIGLLCFIVFLAEGAVLDWSALFLTSTRELDPAKGGLGYAAFAIAMTTGRFTGDAIVRRFGGKRVLLVGGLCAAAGFFLTVLAPSANLALLGFVLVGLGCANIVPILFTAAGSQHTMPASMAVAAITTIGYAGILAGPALIGFIAHATNLKFSFAALGCALLLVAASSRIGPDKKTA